jgi:hypothetical protein
LLVAAAINSSSGSAWKPRHHPSKTKIPSGALTLGHCDRVRRSPSPWNRLLSNAGIQRLSFPDSPVVQNCSKNSSARSASCVPGCPLTLS